MISTYAIKAKNITKKFINYSVLKGISLTVPKGEIFGFIGRNGAGKTTFMRIICGLMKPTGGTYEKVGELSFLPQNVRFRDNMKAGEILSFFGGIKGRDAKESVTFAKELDIDLNKKISTMSPGQQRKLQLAIATIGLPEILVLDEPMAGLDPSGVQQVRSIVQSLNQIGSTVFMSSHVLKELENLCGQIAIIDRGEILYQGNCSDVYEIEAEGIDQKTVMVLREKLSRKFELKGYTLTAEVERQKVPDILGMLYEQDVKVFGVRRQGIETLYNSIVRKEV